MPPRRKIPAYRQRIQKSPARTLAAAGAALVLAVVVVTGAATAGGLAAAARPAVAGPTSQPGAGRPAGAGLAGLPGLAGPGISLADAAAGLRYQAGPVHGAGQQHRARSTQGPARHGTPSRPGQRARPHRGRRPGVCATSALHWWICHAEHVLERHGVPRRKLNTAAAYIVVAHESGGNPRASNGWDVNAAQGHPSQGIAQVIGPTFHAYALPGYYDIWNPVDNMVAAFHYAISRYGSMNNIPGVLSVRHGGSYLGY